MGAGGGMTIDRWYSNSSGLTVTVNDDGTITLSNNGTNTATGQGLVIAKLELGGAQCKRAPGRYVILNSVYVFVRRPGVRIWRGQMCPWIQRSS